MTMKLKKAKDRIQALVREGQIIRQRQAQKKISIPTLPFILTLCIGAVVGYLVFHNHFQGILWGLAASFILFFTVLDDE